MTDELQKAIVALLDSEQTGRDNPSAYLRVGRPEYENLRAVYLKSQEKRWIVKAYVRASSKEEALAVALAEAARGNVSIDERPPDAGLRFFDGVGRYDQMGNQTTSKG